MKTLTELLRAEFPDPEIYSRDDAVAEIVGLVQEWLTALSQDGQVPANRDLRDEYQFLIREAAK